AQRCADTHRQEGNWKAFENRNELARALSWWKSWNYTHPDIIERHREDAHRAYNHREDNAQRASTKRREIQSKYGPIRFWNVSRVTNLDELFSCARTGDLFIWSPGARFPSVSHWNTNGVRSMRSMFKDCRDFDQPLHWDLTTVDTMQGMFFGVHAFQDVGAFVSSAFFSGSSAAGATRQAAAEARRDRFMEFHRRGAFEGMLASDFPTTLFKNLLFRVAQEGTLGAEGCDNEHSAQLHHDRADLASEQPELIVHTLGGTLVRKFAFAKWQPLSAREIGEQIANAIIASQKEQGQRILKEISLLCGSQDLLPLLGETRISDVLLSPTNTACQPVGASISLQAVVKSGYEFRSWHEVTEAITFWQHAAFDMGPEYWRREYWRNPREMGEDEAAAKRQETEERYGPVHQWDFSSITTPINPVSIKDALPFRNLCFETRKRWEGSFCIKGHQPWAAVFRDDFLITDWKFPLPQNFRGVLLGCTDFDQPLRWNFHFSGHFSGLPSDA
ncbi:unnamed protein product, partial [Amoebophrya sp. A120]